MTTPPHVAADLVRISADAQAVDQVCRRLRELRALGFTMDAIEAATGVTVARIERLLEVRA